jgi:hypothetical protein
MSFVGRLKPGVQPDRWILPLLGLIALALATLAYIYAPAAYFRVLSGLMLKPTPTPFIDAQQIPAVISCWNHGINVYLTAPCDPRQRLMDYSPLWLWARFIPAWRNWMGLALDAAFFLSLALLPRPPGPAGRLLTGLAAFSSMTVFALERGNMDLVMFLLIAAGGWCWNRNPAARLLGYGLFTCAGLLKFYPLVLFALFIRERIAAFTALALAGILLLAGFAAAYQAILAQALRNLPQFSDFTDAFSSHQLPDGLPAALAHIWPALAGYAPAAFPLWGSLTICAITLALRLAASPPVRQNFNALQPDQRGFLIIGAALICGCFFAGYSDSYRGIFLLFALPGLLALAPGGRMFGITAGAVLFVMWGLTTQLLIARLTGGTAFPITGPSMIYLYWLIRELAWWWIISVLLATLFCFAAESPAWRMLAPAKSSRPVIGPAAAE